MLLCTLNVPALASPQFCTGLQRNLPLSATCNFTALLSLVGEVDMTAHLGVNLAIGLLVMIRQFLASSATASQIQSRAFRHLSTSKFSKPNHQELLTDLKVVVRDSSERQQLLAG